MKIEQISVKCSQEENLLGEPVRERISWRCGRFRAGRILNRKNKKQKERDTRVEQEDSIRKKLPGWVPNEDDIALEQYNKLTEENKEKVKAFIENLKAGQYTPEF